MGKNKNEHIYMLTHIHKESVLRQKLIIWKWGERTNGVLERNKIQKLLARLTKKEKTQTDKIRFKTEEIATNNKFKKIKAILGHF